ncbi:hypothetical protein, partial [Paenibacillus albilobatus]|uniref:hypothetical protein n=1 Tax=Paenibacillus albilobatus TaxID=2716884 RepID=UPI001BB33150
ILIYAPQIIQPEDLNRFASLSTLQARSNLTRCSVFKDQILSFSPLFFIAAATLIIYHVAHHFVKHFF